MRINIGQLAADLYGSYAVFLDAEEGGRIDYQIVGPPTLVPPLPLIEGMGFAVFEVWWPIAEADGSRIWLHVNEEGQEVRCDFLPTVEDFDWTVE